MASIAAALMVAPLLFALRRWFLAAASGDRITAPGSAEGSERVGLDRVFGRLKEFGGKQEWLETIRSGREHVDLMGRTLNAWTSAPELADLIIERITRPKPVHFRILLMSLENPYLPTLKEKDDVIGIDLRLKISNSIKKFVEIKRSLQVNLQKYLEIRCFEGVPLYCNMVRVDDKVFVAPYVVTEDAQYSPLLQISGYENAWVELYQAEFEKLWRDSAESGMEHRALSDNAIELEGRILFQIQEFYNRAIARATIDKTIDIHNFDHGWDILFGRFFEMASKSEGPAVLRDYTLSNTGHRSYQSWDLRIYPGMLMSFYARKPGVKVCMRFLICCETGGWKNQAAEKFLQDLLIFAYPQVGPSEVTFGKLFEAWTDDSENEEFVIRITNRLHLEALLDADSALLKNPVNVYDIHAVSRSVLSSESGDRNPIPHLQIHWSEAVIDRCTKDFDLAWEESGALQKKIRSTGRRHLKKVGTGELFDIWAKI